jgi:hypothetical protein
MLGGVVATPSTTVMTASLERLGLQKALALKMIS